jgi:hypothetical protein
MNPRKSRRSRKKRQKFKKPSQQAMAIENPSPKNLGKSEVENKPFLFHLPVSNISDAVGSQLMDVS